MQIPVLVEPVAGRGFVARAGAPFGWSAEGATAEEAVARLREQAAAFATGGGRVAAVEVPEVGDPLAALRAVGAVVPPPGDHPLLKWAGTWDPNDPLVQEWMKAIEEYRRQIDNDPNVY